MRKEELQTILEKHQKWLNGEHDGTRANLGGVNLRWANLHKANLRNAALYHADLPNVDLTNADLRGADLREANLYCADLRYADLTNADLTNADLRGADLRGANLHRAALSRAALNCATLSPEEQYRFGVILERKMIGYKKLQNGVICKLEIPKGAVVFCINGSKCRTNIAKVLEGEGISVYDSSFVYKKGRIVKVKDFNLQFSEECASGIHFFRTKKEAMRYEW